MTVFFIAECIVKDGGFLVFIIKCQVVENVSEEPAASLFKVQISYTTLPHEAQQLGNNNQIFSFVEKFKII
jgi:hypothetical protein